MKDVEYAVFGKLYGEDKDKGWMRISRFFPSLKDAEKDVQRLRTVADIGKKPFKIVRRVYEDLISDDGSFYLGDQNSVI